MNLRFIMVVIIMILSRLTDAQDWNQFNSSLVIEVTRPQGVFTCSGVVISPTRIITAAHCLEGEIKMVRVFTSITYHPKEPFFEINSFSLHPSYNFQKSAFKADIAKIEMKKNLPSSINIHPVYQGRVVLGQLYRFGFGLRHKRNSRTLVKPILKSVNTDHKTLELYDQFSRSGDSGGPIFMEIKGSYYLLAIHSTLSSGPEGIFSFNPLVSPYLDWLFSDATSL